jgi:uncharacterized protein (TIGR02594 family)
MATDAEKVALKSIQSAYKGLGYDPGPIDGLWGPRTEVAHVAFAENSGRDISVQIGNILPWVREGYQTFGLHEVTDSKILSAYLKSDGRFLGNPAQLPWCGDWVYTVLARSLPGEPWSGDVERNPYWALNWKGFGKPCPAVYGAIGVFKRPGGGHVGFLIGVDSGYYYVYGGNSGNKVAIIRIAKDRLVASRWPTSYAYEAKSLPTMEAGNIPVSTNEF